MGISRVLSLSIGTIGAIMLTSCVGSGTNNTTANVTYKPFKCPETVNVAFPGVSGIRQVNESTDVYVTGVYVQYGSNHAFLYKGPVLGGGECFPFNFPSAPGRTVTATSLYGPNSESDGSVTVVGTYTTLETGIVTQLGLLYQGASDGSTTNGYTTLDPVSLTTESIVNTLGHSVMGGIVVGNYDTEAIGGKITGRSFIYDISHDTYYNLTKPGGSASITAYGIWYNGGNSYTIAGGYSDVESGGINTGFITDWNSATHEVSHFTSLSYNNWSSSQVSTHFEGITTDDNGGYNLAADWNYPGQKTTPAFANIKRNTDGSFTTPTWTGFGYYPGSTWTSANTVYQNHILGLYQSGDPTVDSGYVVTVNSN